MTRRTAAERAALFQEAAEMFRGGCTPAMIAEELGISRPYVYLALEELGLTREDAGATPRDIEREKRYDAICEAYLAGTPVHRIAAELNVSSATIYMVLVRREIPRGANREMLHAEFRRRKELAIQLYREGVPIMSISAQAKLSNPRIYAALYEAGVPLRSSVPSGIPPSLMNDIVIEYQEGATPESIAAGLNVPLQGVYAVLELRGIEIRDLTSEGSPTFVANQATKGSV